MGAPARGASPAAAPIPPREPDERGRTTDDERVLARNTSLSRGNSVLQAQKNESGEAGSPGRVTNDSPWEREKMARERSSPPRVGCRRRLTNGHANAYNTSRAVADQTRKRLFQHCTKTQKDMEGGQSMHECRFMHLHFCVFQAVAKKVVSGGVRSGCHCANISWLNRVTPKG